MTRQEIIAALNTGADSDIWFDAGFHGDVVASDLIHRTQMAMVEAARLLANKGGNGDAVK